MSYGLIWTNVHVLYMVSAENKKSIKLNLITAVGLLCSCYRQHETIKVFPKSVLTHQLTYVTMI